MSDKLTIEPAKTALLVMDYQAGIVAGYASDQQDLLGRTASLLAAARKAGLAIIYIVVGFRSSYAEVSPRNLSFSAIRQSGRFLASDPGTAIHQAVAPTADEIIITKHRVSAFAGTDLDMILRAKGIEHLVLAGIATSGVVLSTTRHAADADYRITIVRDCCSDRDDEVHRVLMEKIFPRQAAVVALSDLLDALPV
jgi:nicotinamidase-related amidase